MGMVMTGPRTLILTRGSGFIIIIFANIALLNTWTEMEQRRKPNTLQDDRK